MSTTESLEELMPYLNPDYWDGHSIGYGSPTELSDRDSGGILALERGERLLKQRLEHMHSVIAFETYREGEYFDIEQYGVGTVVIFRQEKLKGKVEDLGIDVRDLIGQPLPVRPLDVSPNFDFGTAHESLRYRTISYFTNATWGIIAESKRRQKTLFAAPAGLVHRKGDGKISIASLASHPDSLNHIGKAVHNILPSPKEDYIRRVNILDVVAHGETERTREKAASRAARLAFGRGHS
jgi:hypothetical protein